MINRERLVLLRDWALARASEPSTIGGLLSAVATITGWTIRPDLGPAIATVAGLLTSLLAVLTKEAPKS